MSDDSSQELLPDGLAETIIDSQVPQLIADREACVVLASAGATHLLKCSREDIVGRPMSGLVALSDGGIPCRQIAYCESGEPFTLELLTPDRSVVAVEVYCSRVMVAEDESFCHMILVDLRAHELRAGRRSARCTSAAPSATACASFRAPTRGGEAFASPAETAAVSRSRGFRGAAARFPCRP